MKNYYSVVISSRNNSQSLIRCDATNTLCAIALGFNYALDNLPSAYKVEVFNMLSAEVIGSGAHFSGEPSPEKMLDLDGAIIQHNQTVEIGIRVVDAGLTGASLRFVAKLADHVDDSTDTFAIINKTSDIGGGIDLDPNNTDNIIIGKMKIAASDISLLSHDTQIFWGIHVKNSVGEITLPELRGTFTVGGSLIKTI